MTGWAIYLNFGSVFLVLAEMTWGTRMVRSVLFAVAGLIFWALAIATVLT